MYICCEKIKWHLNFYLTFFVIYFNFPFCVMILKTECQITKNKCPIPDFCQLNHRF